MNCISILQRPGESIKFRYKYSPTHERTPFIQTRSGPPTPGIVYNLEWTSLLSGLTLIGQAIRTISTGQGSPPFPLINFGSKEHFSPGLDTLSKFESRKSLDFMGIIESATTFFFSFFSFLVPGPQPDAGPKLTEPS